MWYKGWHDFEVARETGAPVVAGGVVVRWSGGGSDCGDGTQGKLFFLGGVGGGRCGAVCGGLF